MGKEPKLKWKAYSFEVCCMAGSNGAETSHYHQPLVHRANINGVVTKAGFQGEREIARSNNTTTS